jgi:acyl-lipid omega-6 desaturase (Delta-12 desaturase)
MTTSIVNSENSRLAAIKSISGAIETSILENPHLKLKHIIKSIPRECFQKDMRKAWAKLIINVLMVALGYASLAVAPWYLVPFAWIFTGTALTGFFVIGHDCGHRSFSNRHWVNDLVGHLVFAPLIYPFHAWRIGHNYHHKHTNKLDFDNAWHPIRPEVYEKSSPTWQVILKTFLINKLWWVGSVGHWALVHFDPNNFLEKDRSKVKLSITVVAVFAAIVFPTLIITTGIWGFIKFWVIPWLIYHFWMSTFTYVHHTTADVPFKNMWQWNEAIAQLSGTIHCAYPAWVEFLCHDINVHVPHHISTAIPWYNLRKAYSSIKENWGSYLHEEYTFSWSLMKQLTDECQLYEENEGYLTFKQYEARK